MRDVHDGLKDYAASVTASNILLPPKTLTVTEGITERVYAGEAYYKLSTCKGMSGGCLLYDGTVYGAAPFSRFLTLEGVHVGHIPNMATLFSDKTVRNFLFGNGIGRTVETSLGDFESTC